MTTEGGDDDLGRQLQPHLDGFVRQHPPPVHDSDVEVNVVGNSSPGAPTSTAHPDWETFDDDDDDGPSRPTTLGGDPDQRVGVRQTSGDSPPALRTPPASNNATIPPPKPSSTTDAEVLATDVSVTYHRGGEMVVVGSDVDYSGGVIRTRHLREMEVNNTDRPLRPERIRRLKILSVVAAIVFFPTGLPSVYFAWRIPRLFREGVQQGNIDDALKSARKTQWLVLLSGLLFVLVVVVALAVLDRVKNGPPENFSYVAHNSAQG